MNEATRKTPIIWLLLLVTLGAQIPLAAQSNQWFCPPCGCALDNQAYPDSGVCEACLMRRTFYPQQDIDAGTSYRFSEGHDPQWSEVNFDDSAWQEVEVGTLPEDVEQFWMRYRLKVPPDLWETPLILGLIHFGGAAEIFLDGKSIYKSGVISEDPELYQGAIRRRSEPVVVVFPEGKGTTASDHVLAIRYMQDTQFLSWLRVKHSVRFGFLTMEQYRDFHVGSEMRLRGHQKLLTGFMVAIALIHFLLFFFYMRIEANLYFAMVASFATALVHFSLKEVLISDPTLFLTIVNVITLCNLGLSFLIVRMTYALMYFKPPRYHHIWLIAAIVFYVITWVRPYVTMFMLMAYWLTSVIEVTRVVLSTLLKKRKTPFRGAWIIGLGLLPLVVLFALLLFGVFQISPVAMDTSQTPYMLYGLCSPMVGMSIFLAYNSARTHQHLELKLQQVEDLSAKNLAQERDRALMEAEVARKTEELEKARVLQLSMLPKDLPSLPNLDIAVFMRTAQEVGGDYYDFHLPKDGSLTAVIGDATGHGLQAGIMVATAKGLFNAHADDEPADLLTHANGPMRKMGFKGMFMAMSVARIYEEYVEISAAGMPFPLIYRASTRQVEELPIKGLPLGAFKGAQYATHKLRLGPNDILLLQSDGLAEWFSTDNEMLDHARVRSWFQELGNKPPGVIIDTMMERGEAFAKGAEPEDDMTFVVIKRRADSPAANT